MRKQKPRAAGHWKEVMGQGARTWWSVESGKLLRLQHRVSVGGTAVSGSHFLLAVRQRLTGGHMSRSCGRPSRVSLACNEMQTPCQMWSMKCFLVLVVESETTFIHWRFSLGDSLIQLSQNGDVLLFLFAFHLKPCSEVLVFCRQL